MSSAHQCFQTECLSPELSCSVVVVACLRYQASPPGCSLHSPTVSPVPNLHNKEDLVKPQYTSLYRQSVFDQI